MKMRLGEPQDFEVYKALYEAWECDMLYRAEDSEIKPHLQENSNQYYLDDATIETIKEENRRTLPKFLKYISEDWYPNKRIYMFLDGDYIVGFAEMFRCDRVRWKLEYVCLKEEYQTLKNFTEMMDKLLRMPFIRVLDVCVPYDDCKNRLEEANFTYIGNGFWRRKNEKS